MGLSLVIMTSKFVSKLFTWPTFIGSLFAVDVSCIYPFVKQEQDVTLSIFQSSFQVWIKFFFWTGCFIKATKPILANNFSGKWMMITDILIVAPKYLYHCYKKKHTLYVFNGFAKIYFGDASSIFLSSFYGRP